MFLPRRRGGIGRRAGLKIQWPQGRVGSSPSAGSLYFSPGEVNWNCDEPTLARALGKLLRRGLRVLMLIYRTGEIRLPIVFFLGRFPPRFASVRVFPPIR